jgi:hypothetical protein
MRTILVLLPLALLACSGSNLTNADGGAKPEGGSKTDSGGSNHDAGADSQVVHDSGKSPEGGTDARVEAGGEAGGDAGCQANCVTAHMAGYLKFQGYELSSCGCAAGAPCSSQCTAECADPASLTTTSPCGICLSTQENMGMGSSCTVSAGTTCFFDATCSAFVMCEQACP